MEQYPKLENRCLRGAWKRQGAKRVAQGRAQKMPKGPHPQQKTPLCTTQNRLNLVGGGPGGEVADTNQFRVSFGGTFLEDFFFGGLGDGKVPVPGSADVPQV